MSSVLALSARNADLAGRCRTLLATGLLTATLLAATLLDHHSCWTTACWPGHHFSGHRPFAGHHSSGRRSADRCPAGPGRRRTDLPPPCWSGGPSGPTWTLGPCWHAHRHPIGPDSDARAARPTGRGCAGIGGGRSAVGRSRNSGQRRCIAGIRRAGITRVAGRPGCGLPAIRLADNRRCARSNWCRRGHDGSRGGRGR